MSLLTVLQTAEAKRNFSRKGFSSRLALSLKRAVKKSSLSLTELCRRLEYAFGVVLTVSGLSHIIKYGTIRLQRALQFLAIFEVKEVGIKRPKLVD